MSDTWSKWDDPEPSDDSPLRPAWEDTPDETDADRLRHRPSPARASSAPEFSPLLVPLADATDAFARLDARVTVAPDPIREGLLVRLAFAEAAGWLAHAQMWIHPRDLALRDLGLTGPTALAVTGAGRRILPQTYAGTHRTGWDEQSFDAMAGGDLAVTDALALARTLRRLATATGHTALASVATATAMLAPFGAGPLDPDRFASWRTTYAPPPITTRQYPRRWPQPGSDPQLPRLLAAIAAAQGWLDSGVAAHAAPLPALLVAAALLAAGSPTRAVFLPIWAAYPAVGFGQPDALPSLRREAADRVVGWGNPVNWPIAGLHLIAESARIGLRLLARLEAAAVQGRALVDRRCDKRSRLPAALDALLRVPVLTAKTLSERLRVAPQTGTALLRVLAAEGLVEEVTGRGRFRAFAL